MRPLRLLYMVPRLNAYSVISAFQDTALEKGKIGDTNFSTVAFPNQIRIVREAIAVIISKSTETDPTVHWQEGVFVKWSTAQAQWRSAQLGTAP